MLLHKRNNWLHSRLKSDFSYLQNICNQGTIKGYLSLNMANVAMAKLSP